MKLLIVGGNTQPIPPVNGGAVENLVKMFYDVNEKEKEIEISIISCFDSKISLNNNHYMNYNKTYFYLTRYTKKTRIEVLANKVNVILNKIFNHSFVFVSNYVNSIVDCIKDNNIEFDVILVENYLEPIIRLKKEFPNKPVFLHLHNDKLNKNIINGKKISSCCDGIITVSNFIKNRVCSIEENINKTFTLINSINIDDFGKSKYKESTKFLKKKYKIKSDEKVLIFAGRLAKNKGVKELIYALINIKNENFRLLIVGNSWYGNTKFSDKYVEELKKISQIIKDKIIFTGYVDYEDIPKYYSLADMAVIPSIWQEPCSLTLFESMATGLPLITTNTGGTPEVVENNALLIDVDSNFIDTLSKKIKFLLDNKEKRDEYSKLAYNHVQQYNPKRYYKELISIIYSLWRS